MFAGGFVTADRADAFGREAVHTRRALLTRKVWAHVHHEKSAEIRLTIKAPCHLDPCYFVVEEHE